MLYHWFSGFFTLQHSVCTLFLAAISKYPKVAQNKLITCQYKVPTKVGVVNDSKDFFPPKQKILDETLISDYWKLKAMYVEVALECTVRMAEKCCE